VVGGGRREELGGAPRAWLEGHRGPLVVAVVLAAVGYSFLAASTTPFTWDADLVVAIAFLPVAGVMAQSLHRRRAVRDEEGILVHAHRRADERLWPWVVAITAICLWELIVYFAGWGGHRSEFPTGSVIYDDLSAYLPVKALLFFAWLVLGWRLVRR
jgi:hypothetical protein